LNYLSHYYVSHIPGNVYYNLGLILPDLTRGFVKNFKQKDFFPSSAVFKNIYNGCMKHYEDDKKFHQLHFFENGSKECTKLINETFINHPLNRKWFLGHIIFELFIDRILVYHAPGIANKFYSDLEKINYKEVEQFLNLFNCSDTSRMLTIIHNFYRAAYIKNYIDNNLFVFSLNKIMIKAKAGELTQQQKQLLIEVSWQIDNLILKDKLSVFYLLNSNYP